MGGTADLTSYEFVVVEPRRPGQSGGKVTNQERQLGTNKDVGKSIDLGSIPSGSELIFGIHTRGPGIGPTFRTGPANRNPDNIEHATVELFPDEDRAVVGFEDLLGGGDRDYDDAILSVSGGITLRLGRPRVKVAAGLELRVFDKNGVEGSDKCTSGLWPDCRVTTRPSL